MEAIGGAGDLQPTSFQGAMQMFASFDPVIQTQVFIESVQAVLVTPIYLMNSNIPFTRLPHKEHRLGIFSDLLIILLA
eukprot:scaffold595_cov40-Skeletonema_menzelii.AAC.1